MPHRLCRLDWGMTLGQHRLIDLNLAPGDVFPGKVLPDPRTPLPPQGFLPGPVQQQPHYVLSQFLGVIVPFQQDTVDFGPDYFRDPPFTGGDDGQAAG